MPTSLAYSYATEDSPPMHPSAPAVAQLISWYGDNSAVNLPPV